ncbi:T9SS type A sorting domain-containing protein [bacterium]|nr:T9SS type A sorting domain-containing protein [bacterium]
MTSRFRRTRRLVPVTFLIFILALAALAQAATPLEKRADGISGGAEAISRSAQVPPGVALHGSPTDGTGDKAFVPGIGFPAFNFDDNALENGGFLFIPPDPMGAAGPDRLVGIVNAGIECRTKTGLMLFRDSLRDFFSPLGAATLGTFCFDPKIVYDHYEDRFVVVALERWFQANGDPSNESRILIAVSKTASPASPTAADWNYMAINSKVNIGGFDHWADYPGFEVDEEAVYVTANMFPFVSGTGGTRLWIVDKGVAAGFYAGGPAAHAVYDPIPAGYFSMTMQPAEVHGPGGVGGPGSNIGTFLVAYSSLTYGGPGNPEAVQVIRVDDPLGAPTFTGEFVTVGDIEDVGGVFGFPALPDAPQAGGVGLIEVNDSRALDAVWRNGSLWAVTTINPNATSDPVNAGQTTAHWFRFDTTSVPGPIVLTDEGNIGGEDIQPGAYTFFPGLAVNANGDVKFGFAASGANIFAGAYMAGREAGDPPGTVQATGVVRAGVDYYYRTFGGSRNRWGDYSGVALDPADDTTFWIFNEYAEVRGTPISGEDGRWGTAWRACAPTAPGLIVDVYPISGLTDPVSLFSKLDGSGDPMFAAQLWNGVIGDPTTLTDATIGVTIRDVFGTPIVGFPREQIFVRAQFGGWAECPTAVLHADFDTDASGFTTISRALHAGGSSAPGELMLVIVNDPLVTTTTYPLGLPGLQYWVNSTDLTGNLVTDLTDVSAFAGVYFAAAYDYAGDFRWDGKIDLTDVTRMASGLAAACPPAKALDVALGTAGEVGLRFDSPQGGVARDLAPGERIDAYLVLAGDAARHGIEAFAARLRTSDNVIVHETELLGRALNLGTDTDLVVGYGATRGGADEVTLARVRLSVTNAMPASFWLEGAKGMGGPAVVIGDGMEGVVPTSGAVEAPVARLNDKDFQPGENLPMVARLAVNVVPNPFNPRTEIRFALPAAGEVSVRVYDAAGRLVRALVQENRAAGPHVVVWNGDDDAGRKAASGVYWAQVKSDGQSVQQKMVLLK